MNKFDRIQYRSISITLLQEKGINMKEKGNETAFLSNVRDPDSGRLFLNLTASLELRCGKSGITAARQSSDVTTYGSRSLMTWITRINFHHSSTMKLSKQTTVLPI